MQPIRADRVDSADAERLAPPMINRAPVLPKPDAKP
jgi:hypothetical protein